MQSHQRGVDIGEDAAPVIAVDSGHTTARQQDIQITVVVIVTPGHGAVINTRQSGTDVLEQGTSSRSVAVLWSTCAHR